MLGRVPTDPRAGPGGDQHDEQHQEDLSCAVAASAARGATGVRTSNGTDRCYRRLRRLWTAAPRTAAVRTTAELREGFEVFFEEKGDLRRPSASLIPRADAPLDALHERLGTQLQMPYFLGREAPPAPPDDDVPEGLRTPDIDEVGPLTRSTSMFFEMLGNFSFGQYFKEGAIEYADRIHPAAPEARLGPGLGERAPPATRS